MIGHVLIALLYCAAGVLIIVDPVLASGVITLVLAGILIAAGVIRIVMGIQQRNVVAGWYWSVLSGIEAEAFPGWDGFSGLTAHLRFVRDHHRSIRRVAVVSDSVLLSRLPQLAGHFVAAEVRHFPRSARAKAVDWLRAS